MKYVKRILNKYSRLINNILASTQIDACTLANACCWPPLEILLGRHGKEVIADVERLAKI